ncbi:MAG: SEC-C metal-binding domain-containing protein [Lachnospiraceae bacterium]
MSLLTDWREKAYSKEMNEKEGQVFWMAYFAEEKEVYEQLLSDPETEVKGTVKELAEKYNMKLETFVGFLDGINDSLVTPNPIEEMTEDTEVSLKFDKEKLYYNMVDCRADWLYQLPQWDNLLTPERRKELYMEQRKSGTVVKPKKVGRNDPCPCGSGRKYKQCCGKA